MDTVEEKVLVYLGPSLSLARAREILPDAIYRAPAKQGDLLSDMVNLSPTHIILIDGVFDSNLSPWHKEIVYGLQFPGIQAIYGASSMGALRASECDWIGMIGVGQIYQWYRDGITEDDAEVALSYAERIGSDGEAIYYPNTVPLCNIRAAAPDPQFFKVMQAVHYTERTPKLCEETWGGPDYPCIDQKALDAIEALTTFRSLKPAPQAKPGVEHLSYYFQALYDRDRQLVIQGQAIPQQHIDSYVLLHNPEYERIAWDAANQELALMLCDCLCVMVDPQEVDAESARFWQRAGIETPAEFAAMLETNGWTQNEYQRLIIQNARIHKLQHANTVTKMWRRNTRSILDYLRTHQAFDYWALEAAKLEARIKKNGADEWLGVDPNQNAFAPLAEHFEREGLDLKMSPEDFLLETGFSNQTELAVALARINAGKGD